MRVLTEQYPCLQHECLQAILFAVQAEQLILARLVPRSSRLPMGSPVR